MKSAPLRISNRDKREIRTQFGALCWRRKNKKIQFLLVTSRGTQRWIVPKGWPMPGRNPAQAAATEAYEEAGVTGKISTDVAGLYTYRKRENSRDDLSCIVVMFPLKVRKKHNDFPERHQRKRKWMSRKKAAKRVDDSELREIILNFDPD